MSRELPPEDRSDEPDEEPIEPSILPTPPRVLLVAALLGAVVGWLLGPVVENLGRTPMHVPWTTAAMLAVAAVAVAVLARRMWRTVHVRRRPVTPERGLYSLVLGKSAALLGAALFGGYLVFGASFLPRLEIAAGLTRAINSGLAALASAGLCAAGYALEMACRVPQDKDRRADRKGDGSARNGDTHDDRRG
ncbi:DUF3180 domain-containing protein [Raineyella sp. LH-20]|uniref:DUF3180 domain-containing protein n=1 Tax=Raineyella sp. LH-20 TaxID=3081204 RepID=UPI0029537AB3|nr:DUF3180 domain-containing protein [Raineyella sp. LH-20]WOP17249.1 DUF3180 domain-containing protein [Raineyella sp. LH-20]